MRRFFSRIKRKIKNGPKVLEWGTLEGNIIYTDEMLVQHISNILDMFDKREYYDIKVYKILEEELKYRQEERLPFKPYYSDSIEKKLRSQ